jgi:hypothetical protein
MHDKPNDAVVVRPTQNHSDDTADREASTPATATSAFVAHNPSILIIKIRNHVLRHSQTIHTSGILAANAVAAICLARNLAVIPLDRRASVAPFFY